MAKRLAAMGQTAYQRVVNDKGRWNGHVELIESALNKPLGWKKPCMIFVDSMSDLFHEAVDALYIGRVLNVMAKADWHTFQVLTKRPQRMMEVVNLYCETFRGGKPLPNVWFITSVENQKAADERIPFLVRTNAVVRGLSCEPLLGRVDLKLMDPVWTSNDPEDWRPRCDFIDWVICGGESGPQARAMHPDWARFLRDQCVSLVPFFFKQWGEYLPVGGPEHYAFEKMGKKKAGRVLDGRTWDEFPVKE
jgi:protein gp37